MILSASVKADIPALYGGWFMKRIRDGFLDIGVADPHVPGVTRTDRYALSPSVIDAILLWTRNPIPFLAHFHELNQRGYYYVTNIGLTPYEKKVEPEIKNKRAVLESFSTIAALSAPNRVVWHYGPIIMTEFTDAAAHLRTFRYFAERIKGTATTVVFSGLQGSLDAATTEYIGYSKTEDTEMAKLVSEMAMIAIENEMQPSLYAGQQNLARLTTLRVAPLVSGSQIANMRGAVSHGYNSDVYSSSGLNTADYLDIGLNNCCTQECAYCQENNKRVHFYHGPEDTSLSPIRDIYSQKPIDMRVRSNLNFQLLLMQM